jgi:hypothetical protein
MTHAMASHLDLDHQWDAPAAAKRIRNGITGRICRMPMLIPPAIATPRNTTTGIARKRYLRRCFFHTPGVRRLTTKSRITGKVSLMVSAMGK